ncbi:MAG: hypothetical protein ACI9EW_003104 [Cellvibrionaceae bacterium]|jgi:hypothetical protein
MARKKATAKQKTDVRKRANGLCEYCRSPEMFSTELFSVEHIVPVALDGKTELDNLALACMRCNGHKYIKIDATDPVSGKRASLFHPRNDLWQDHFDWSGDFLEVIGMTPVGRGTVEALKLNRPHVQNLRRALFAIGEHPPSEQR